MFVLMTSIDSRRFLIRYKIILQSMVFIKTQKTLIFEGLPKFCRVLNSKLCKKILTWGRFEPPGGKVRSFLFFFIIAIVSSVYGWNSEIPPFEKIYVEPSRIVTFHDGPYYCDDFGRQTKISKLFHDANGPYILMVYYQCPVCNQCWTTPTPPEGYDCPLFKREVYPGIWTD